MASGPAGRKLDLPVTASCGDGGGAAVYRWWRQRRQRQRQRQRRGQRRGPGAGAGAGAQGVEKDHNVTAAGTEDLCLVRERQHHVARPQELAHPCRVNCQCRGEQPSRLSRPASCRVPEPWAFNAPVHGILAVGFCHGTGTGWDTRRDRRDACSPLMPPHAGEPPRVIFRAARKPSHLSAKRLIDPFATTVGAMAERQDSIRAAR